MNEINKTEDIQSTLEQKKEAAEVNKEQGTSKEVSVTTSKAQMYRANWYHGCNSSQRNHKMNPYIFKTKKGIDIINLDEAKRALDRALNALRKCVSKSGRVMFVGTDDEISAIVEETAKRCGQGYISKKWPGGLLTNFESSFTGVINNMKLTKKKIEAEELDYVYNKKEQAKIKKKNNKLFEQLGGIKDMTRLPDMVVVTSMREKNAIKECAKKGIPCIVLVDTNANPFSVKSPVKYPVPGNDRSIQTVSLFLAYCGDYCLLGLRDESLMSLKEQQEKSEQAKSGGHSARQTPKASA